MTVPLPQPIPSTSAWQPADFLRRTMRTSPAAGGLAQLDFGALADTEMWVLSHAVVHCTSSTPTALRLYESVPDPGWLLDGSDRGTFDVADWPAGLQVSPSASLVAVWEGASDGAVGTLRVQGTIYRKA